MIFQHTFCDIVFVLTLFIYCIYLLIYKVWINICFKLNAVSVFNFLSVHYGTNNPSYRRRQTTVFTDWTTCVSSPPLADFYRSLLQTNKTVPLGRCYEAPALRQHALNMSINSAVSVQYRALFFFFKNSWRTVP